MKIVVFGGHGDGANRIPAKWCTTDVERAYSEGTNMHILAGRLGTIPGVVNLRPEAANITWAERARRAAEYGADFSFELHTNWSTDGPYGPPNRGSMAVIHSICYEDGAAQAARCAEEGALAQQMFAPLAAQMGLRLDVRTRKGGGLWDYYSFINEARHRGIKHPMIVEHGYHQDFCRDIAGYTEMAYKNMQRILGVTGSTPTPIPEPTVPYEPIVGDVVWFAGGGIYRSANSTTSATQRGSGPCRVTQVYDGAHPYHLISTDGEGIYGWADAAAVSKSSAPPSPILRVGATVRCSGTPLYSNSYDYATATRTITGTYTVTRIIEGRKHGIMLNTTLGWVSPASIAVIA